MTRKVVVVPHDPYWVVLFEIEANALRQIFGEQAVAIHHIGSTSIPGLSAKPIIDILLTVRDLERVEDFAGLLERSGYHAQGEYGIPGRRFFFKGSHEDRSHHLHIYQYDNPNILRHIAFRDYMRSHAIPATEYAQLKERLAREFPEDMEGYIAGKNDFIKEQEQAALDWWKRRIGQGVQGRGAWLRGAKIRPAEARVLARVAGKEGAVQPYTGSAGYQNAGIQHAGIVKIHLRGGKGRGGKGQG